MSVLDYTTGDKFVVRIVKHLATNPANRWANSYEFVATASGGSTELTALATTVQLFEQPLHQLAVRYDHALVSTWEEDSKPYDPSSFISIPLFGAGDRDVGAEMEPLNMCYSIARVPSSGRFGHIFLRGSLNEQDVTSPAGKPIFVLPATIQAELDNAIEGSELGIYLGDPAEGNFQMVMINKTGTQVRSVTRLVPIGISHVPQDHAWFNRTSTP